MLGLQVAGATDDSPAYTRTEDVVYGRKHGLALTLDVFAPVTNNGCGLLWLVSAGYGSSHDAINPRYFRPLLERGYTVFAVVHGSAPRFSVAEVEADVLQAARFVRNQASRFHVDSNRLGAIGASAGGHLALTLATKGTTQAVACAVAFFPPTDYLNYGATNREAAWIEPLLGLPTHLVGQPHEALGTAARRDISVLYFIASNQPPVLIFQGDKDYLVPVDQAQSFARRYKEFGNTVRLVPKPGAGHGWPEMSADMQVAADWLDEHLRQERFSDGRAHAGSGQ